MMNSLSIMKIKFNWNALFLLMLVVGVVVFIILDYIETRPYEGDVSTIEGTVQKSVYVSRGTITGKSFTRVYLDDGRTFKMPLGEMILLQKGDIVSLSVPKELVDKNIDDIRVIEYDVKINVLE
ncbi:MAG: hypothetical protein A2W76_08260 [Gammaproteobacteria bacterium RIFCSPLOWO2_12_47_11]|nr:MAG: hypothetical protein A2W76_08260 [Gammaproteobacteria bacterium RIFCSPLOWO2_12_47_11]